MGRHTEAIAEAKRALELAPDLAWSKSVVAQLSARAGDKDTALKLIEEIKKMPPNNTSYMIAIDYACLGQKDQAFEWLNKAYESKDWSLNRVGVEPWIDNIGSDPLEVPTSQARDCCAFGYVCVSAQTVTFSRRIHRPPTGSFYQSPSRHCGSGQQPLSCAVCCFPKATKGL